MSAYIKHQTVAKSTTYACTKVKAAGSTTSTTTTEFSIPCSAHDILRLLWYVNVLAVLYFSLSTYTFYSIISLTNDNSISYKPATVPTLQRLAQVAGINIVSDDYTKHDDVKVERAPQRLQSSRALTL
jgi:hypothetical protein